MTFLAFGRKIYWPKKKKSQQSENRKLTTLKIFCTIPTMVRIVK